MASQTRAGRYDRLREIESRDIDRDYSTVWLLDMAYEFPWDMQVGGSVGFYCSLAPPRMAALLAHTRELTGDTARRIDDTNILMWEMFRNGFSGPRGKAAVRQMNRIHRNAVRHANKDGGTWSITNDEYLFVLSAIMVNMVRAVDRYGWRRFSDAERRAACLHFRDMGAHMGITDMPETFDGFARFHDAYLADEVAYSADAAALWQATSGMFTEVLIGWLPPRLHPLASPIARRIMPALLGPELCRAFGLAAPSRALTGAVTAALRLRSAYVRRTRPRTESAMPDVMPTARFPEGDYEFPDVGPDHLIH
ncbi:oxygenase MpaB family protein [Nocardiopsis mangrovi]|uniref:Oxygenase MpaB family protein n=1 Tax=Nocardiopsis mangrovi TaxID=1179818 RepID=A0ABV9DRI8_9ACTN